MPGRWHEANPPVEDLAGGWLFHFIHRLICFWAGHRADAAADLTEHPLSFLPANTDLLHPYIIWKAYLVICFRCGAVRCRSIQGPIKL